MKKMLLTLPCCIMIACQSNPKDAKKEESTVAKTDSATTTQATDGQTTEKAAVVPAPMMIIEKLADPFPGDSALLDIGDNKYITVYTEKAETEKSAEDDGPRCPSVDDEQKCKSDIFQGCIRGNVKTTMLTGKPDSYSTIRPLLAKLKSNSPDLEMKTKGILSAEASLREPEENKNVLIKTAYLYMIYREPDNDYHMIIGDSPRFAGANLMNVEVSGIPRGAKRDVANRFMLVRNKIKSHPKIGDIKCGTVRDIRRTPLLITNLIGSLYFDNPHDAGSVGRMGVEVPTAWEIHPIKDLTFGSFQ